MPGSEVVSPARPVLAVSDPSRARKQIVVFVIVLAVVLLAGFLLSRAGVFLTVHAPGRSDVIVVLDGRWPKGVELQKDGYAPRILLDVGVNNIIYGRSEADLASEFLRTSKMSDIEICPVSANSTYGEVADVQRCLQPLHARSVLLVASDFDTRRALETFRDRLPQYRWSVAASSAPYHDADQYWKHRAWAKTVLTAWNQYLWWKLADQRRADLVLH